jgi:electron transfer flavoprotein-quinone oxidoreductase
MALPMLRVAWLPVMPSRASRANYDRLITTIGMGVVKAFGPWHQSGYGPKNREREVQEVDFDVIVIGAGISGCVTALALAQKEHSVLLVDRGVTPGSKNLSGGVFYCRVMEEVIENFVEVAPIERRITCNRLSFMSEDSCVTIDYHDRRLSQSATAVSVQRARLDEWLGNRCEEAGVMLMSKVRVDSLVVEGDQIVGIRAGTDEVRAHVVVAADGVNSFICKDRGIRGQEPSKHLAVGIKSTIALPRQAIEERFNVQGDEGVAYALVGDCTKGMAGGGFLYTNLESISIGVVIRLDDLIVGEERVSDVHDRFINHGAMGSLLKDGELLEYGCHMVPEGGKAMVHDLVRPGLVVVGDAAGMAINTGLTVRGMDLAAGSALVAARVIDSAIHRADFSEAGLRPYITELNRGFVGSDLTTFAKAPRFMENPRLYKAYGELLSDCLYGVYNLDTSPRRHLKDIALQALKDRNLRILQVIGDAIAGVRAL